jgi:hypothetical protein
VSELFFEETAHRAGFIVSVGNWITPDGKLILGQNNDTHHWETIKEYFGYEPETENRLTWMHERIDEGFIRLVFRNDVLFQVGCKLKEEIWGDSPNYEMLMGILKKLENVEIHIFSRKFYILGFAENILNNKLELLQIQEE